MKEPSPSLDRDQQILSRLARIQHKVDSLEQTTAFALRADADRHFQSVKHIFRNSKRKAQVYLAANGQRSVAEIAEHLSMKQPNVSSILRVLHEEGLVEIIDAHGGSNTWARTALDRTLRITRFLRQEYRLDGEGKRANKKAR